ncbi:MAG TPA: sigma factor [Candidatus Polarisedimenticolia bacterium]|nr:sigma factor [Candidatus Polarisedimenticolia bacterium]
MDDGSLSELQGLMGRLADGDRSAFSRVFEVLWPVLRDLTGRHLPPAEAEDAAQEALLRIFRRSAEFDARRSALAWALGIAHWEIRSVRKKRMRRREESMTDGAMDHRSEQATPEEALLVRDTERMLAQALGTLASADLETLRQYRNGERATVAAATFRKRVERALGRLRSAWRMTHGNL